MTKLLGSISYWCLSLIGVPAMVMPPTSHIVIDLCWAPLHQRALSCQNPSTTLRLEHIQGELPPPLCLSLSH